MPTIPANIFWPAFIIGLLSVAIGASFTILYFAQSDGGPQVIPDYYERSVNFDDVYEARQNSIRLGWSVDIELFDDHGELTLQQRDGTPVDGAEGTLTFFRPSQALPIATVELVEDADEPGEYRFDNIADLPGLWDLDVDIERGDEAFTQIIRHTVPNS